MEDIRAYNNRQEMTQQKICNLLAQEIEQTLPNAKGKVWHGGPVWFIHDNPIVGYWVRKKGDVQLLFWSGQSFEEPYLRPEGTFKAAEVRYLSASEIAIEDLRRWLKKSEAIQWDYKNIVKHKGALERLT